MMRTFFSTLGACLLVIACGGDAPEVEQTDDPQDIAEAVEAMQRSGSSEPVDADDLAELFPDELIGLERAEMTRQSSGAMGVNVAIVNAVYGERGRQITLTVTDYPAGGPALAAASMWATTSFSRETDTSFERTTELDGHRAFERHDQANGGRGEVSAIVANRAIVSFTGRGVTANEMREAVDDFGLGRLERRLGG